MKYPGTDLDWFVVGFPFTQKAGGGFPEGSVLLVEKQKSWCKGLWNGVGGGVEPEDDHSGRTVNKMSVAAMVREFREETGLSTELGDWECFCMLEEPKAMVFFYRSFVSQEFLAQARQTTIEAVRLVGYLSQVKMMPNLAWLIPMALHKAVVLARVDEQGGQYDGKR